ncbi:MAG: 50S ribosomal protein L23 [Parachlamydiaceae bacterium]|nr:50S ribosomal protein L23 [Parachlamydiaceae bacterium]
MTQKSPYQVIKHKHVTEKSMMLQGLKTADSNPSLKRCESPKYVFIVDRAANKQEIANALEQIYKDEGIKVVAVNTINVKAKARRVRGRAGYKSGFRKAIVTLRPGDSLDNV